MRDRIVLLTAVISLGFNLGRGQAVKRCDLLVNSTPGAGADTACLDLVALTQTGGPAIQVGNNVTRISNAGLKLCANAFTVSTGGSADIVFIYDNSGSMWSHRATIDSVAQDTTFWDATGCNMAGAASVTYAVQDTAYARPPQSLLKTIPLLSNAQTSCREYAGDPYNARGAVIRNAIRYLAQKAPTSTAGAVGFAQTTQFPQPPLQLNVAANIAQVSDMIRLDSIPATYYAPPLRLAKSWLSDTTVIKNPRQAIVFISDGNPSDGNAALTLVDSAMPPIYSIFLGKVPTPDTANLKQLSDLTHGLFFRVDPSKPAGIQVVMDSIIRKITETNVPKSIAITNTTIGQTSVAGPMSVGAGGNLVITLDSIIALTQGKNDFSVTVTKSDGTVGKYAFTVKADGVAEAQTTKTTQCYDPPILTMLNSQGQPDAQYSLTATSYTIKLTRSPADIGPVIVTAITKDSMQPPTPGWGDAESVALAAAGASGVYQSPYPFNGQSAKPTPGNGTLEAAAAGQIVLSWVYPRDARDFATFTLPGSKMLVTQPPSATPPGAVFTTLDPDIPVTLVPGEAGSVIHYTVDGTTPTANSPIYSAPIMVATTTTIKAVAIKLNQFDSPVMVAVFTETTAPKVAKPTATPPGASNASPYAFPISPLAVTLADATPGAIIHYSLDGAAPVDGASLSVAKSATLKAYATKAGMYPSDTLTIRFDYQAPSDVTVLFPDGSKDAGGVVPAPTSAPNIAFIPVDKFGVALPGNTNGKCGTCPVGNGKTFVGPIINLDIPGPVEYEFKIFSTMGEYLIGGTGKVDAADIPLLAPAADGTRYRLRVIWTGRCNNQEKAGTGAYILKSMIRNAEDPATAAQSPLQKKLIVFGYVRPGG